MRMRFSLLLRFSIWPVAITGGLVSTASAGSKGRDAAQIYAELCAGCHGQSLEGGKGGALTNRSWKNGSDEAGMIRSIRDGMPATGMPAFARSVNEAEMTALVAFIREVGTRKNEPTPTTDQPLPQGVQQSAEHAYRIETVAEGLDIPWSFSFLPDGRMLVTERTGRLRMIENGIVRPEMIGGLPAVMVKGEGGLMSVVVHPDYAQNGWIYLSFSDPGPSETSMTKLIRARLRDWQLVDHETVFSIPREKYQHGYALFGGRLVFDGDHLFFSVGVRGLDENVTAEAQDTSLVNGKIHRLFHDGTIPPDNPFARCSRAQASIWAYGVRNPQGLARDPRNGALWETEHGPRGGDELNRIVRGKNYGWPTVTHGMNYDGTPISEKTEAPGMESPIQHWTPSIAVSQIEFYTGDRFPRWKNQLFLGSLAAQKFLRLTIDDGRVTHTEEIFKNHGRVRDIKTGPDGFLYLALELIGKPGKIVRLVPADEEREFETSSSL
jgi:glucose/arabinose dehydrogenase